MKHTRAWLFTLSLALAGCGVAPLAGGPSVTTGVNASSAGLVAQLRQAASPLAGTEPGAQRSDLEAFGQAVGEASIVGLGEGTHGTREFFRMKHRLFEYLVEQKGFSVFALEGHLYVAQALDAYVKTGKGDPRAILASEVIETWHMEELLELVQWMRAYNRKRGGAKPLSFASFDVQNPIGEVQAVLAHIERHAPDKAIAAALAYDLSPLATGTPEVKEAKIKAVKAIEALVARTAGGDRVRVRHYASVVSRSAEMLAQLPLGPGTVERYFALRDAGMAANVEWLAKHEYPGQKIALWAHNGHVGDFADYAGLKGAKTLGYHLKRRYKDSYYNLGFTFYRGAATAQPDFGQPFRAITLAPAKAGSVGHTMHQLGLPQAFVDTRAVAAGSGLGRWLRQAVPMRNVGYVIPPGPDDGFYMGVKLVEAFDGLIHVDVSSPARHYGLALDGVEAPMPVLPPAFTI